MRVLQRYLVTDTNLTASNMVEDDAPEWDAATTYSADDEVRVTEYHRVYVSAVDSNLGNVPPEQGDPTLWILKGATNKWAAFDDYVANRTENADEITYTIEATEQVTSVAFFGLTANSVTVTVSKDGSSQTYTQDLLSLDHINGSLWNWLTGGRPKPQEYAFLSLAYFGSGTTYEITIENTGSTAKVGQVVLGAQYDLGITHIGASLGRQRFDRLFEDEFGNVTIVRRLSARLTEMQCSKLGANFRATDDVLDKISGTFTVFVGSEEPERGLILFGFLRDYEIRQETKDVQRIRLQVRGLI